MVKFREVAGYINFVSEATRLTNINNPVYVLFFGGPSDQDSWCPDCQKAKPFIDEVLKSTPDDTIFIHVNVGEREKWKSPSCEFRNSTTFPVNKIPTLVRWDTKQTLTEDECADLSKLRRFF